MQAPPTSCGFALCSSNLPLQANMRRILRHLTGSVMPKPPMPKPPALLRRTSLPGAWMLVGLICAVSLLIGCQGLVSARHDGPQNLQAINHIVFMIQENRSLDHYFGRLPQYWQSHGFPSQKFDGLPADASNPSFDGTRKISAF